MPLMRNGLLMALLTVLLLAGCVLSPHGGPAFIWSDQGGISKTKVSGRHGSSYKKSVVISHSPSPEYTAGLEEIWMQRRKIRLQEGSGLRRISQHLDDRVYDVVTITTESGETKLFYFDITHSN